jgi:ABC-type sugar transport system, periplasmic component
MGREGEVVQALMREFERQHPGIRVRVQQIPWSAAHEKLLTAYAGEAMPDVFQLGNTWIPEFVALRALTPLDPWMKDSLTVAQEDFFPGIMQTNVIDGLIYGVPWYVDTRLMFYRKDILKRAGYPEPPRTWNTWIDAMRRIKETAGPQHYAILLPLNDWTPPVILALQLNAHLLKDDHQYGNFRGARFRQAFTFYIDLFRKKLAPRLGNAEIANVYQEFANGYFSMYISGPWNIGEFSRRLPDALKEEWMTAPMPGPNSNQPGSSIAGGASLVISRSSNYKKDAWTLIEYLSESAQQITFYRLTGDLPARKTAWQNATLADDLYAQAFLKQLQSVESTPKIPEWERIASKIAQYSEAVIREEMTVDEALTALDKDVDRILEKRRWLLKKHRAKL